MPAATGMDVLAGAIKRLQDVAEGRARAAMLKAMTARALALAQKAFAFRQAPSGTRWRPGAGGVVPSLVRSGALRAAIQTQGRPGGFAIIDRVANPKTGRLYGGSQIYGRTYHAYLRRAGGARLRMPSKWQQRTRWRVPGRPFVPKSGQMPADWARAFRAAADKVM